MQYWLWKFLCLGLASWCGSVNVWRLTAILVTRITHNHHRHSTQTNTHSLHRSGVCYWGDLYLFSLSLLMTLFILFFDSPALDKKGINVAVSLGFQKRSCENRLIMLPRSVKTFHLSHCFLINHKVCLGDWSCRSSKWCDWFTACCHSTVMLRITLTICFAF